MSDDNSGVLFKNTKKRDGKSDADYTGNITVAGKEYWLNSWINKSKDGTKTFMSLKLKIKEANVPAPTPTKFGEEIPF